MPVGNLAASVATQKEYVVPTVEKPAPAGSPQARLSGSVNGFRQLVLQLTLRPFTGGGFCQNPINPVGEGNRRLVLGLLNVPGHRNKPRAKLVEGQLSRAVAFRLAADLVFENRHGE